MQISSNEVAKKNQSKKFERAGYRIHFDRLRDLRSSISAIRTHKFKCEIPKEAEQDLQNKFQDVASVVEKMWLLIKIYQFLKR